jgi:serine protease
MKKLFILSSLLLLAAVLTLPVSLSGQQIVHNAELPIGAGMTAPPTDQIIVRFADQTAANQLLYNGLEGALPQLSAAAGVEMRYAHPMSLDSHVLKLPDRVAQAEAEQIALQLTQVEGVVHAEADRILNLFNEPAAPPIEAVPNDPLWGQMWHLHYIPGASEGINAALAWDLFTGSYSVVVAVIDTGILQHNDIANRLVPGYDFISDPWMANDGNGRDPDPTDAGDWVLANQCPGGNLARNSSWHGLHVAGTIGATANNGIGITGVDWQARILPIRVLGRCGGYTSDIVDGMLWSAGFNVPGVPANANPANVLNLSLGGSGLCSATQQNAINAIVNAGSVIVVAAGNENQNVANVNPANCNNVIAVAATNRTGSRAFYSNNGNLVKISAPGGETGVNGNGVLSTLDSGATTANNSHSYDFYQGTSMAAPHVAGVAALIMGRRPGYTPAQALSLLQSSARPFPAGSSCNTSICGAGIVDARRALEAIPPFVATDWLYLPIVNRPTPPPPPPPPTGPTPGFWQNGTGSTEFYVTPDRANIDRFAIYIYVDGCGGYKITRTTLTPINNDHFSFSGLFYASGTFTTQTAANGQLGLTNFYISGCGYISGGPWNYTANWVNGSQPAAYPAWLPAPDSVEPLSNGGEPFGYLVESVE